MTDAKQDLERKAFEEWYCSSISESIGLERYPNGCFCNPEAENMYLAWCAAKSHAEQSEWISVEDRLPRVDVYVLAATSRGMVIIDRVYGWGTSSEWISGHSNNPITHWRPFPTPPKQGDKK